MRTNSQLIAIAGGALLLVTWLLVGVYRDNEFYEPDLFLKHRPAFQVSFYSPAGMSDRKVSDLPPVARAEELAFQELVIDRQIQGSSGDSLWFVPLILIQLSLTLLVAGVTGMMRNLAFKAWQVLVHFAIGLLLTSVCIGLMLNIDQWLATIAGGLIILMLNFGVLLFIARRYSTLPAHSAAHNLE